MRVKGVAERAPMLYHMDNGLSCDQKFHFGEGATAVGVDPDMKRPYRIAAALLGIPAIFIILVRLRLPSHTFLWREIHNAGHVILFGILALLFLVLSFELLGRVIRSAFLHYLISFLSTALVGLALEIYQISGPGDADVVDLLRDLAGASSFLAFHAVFAKGPVASGRRGAKTVLFALAVAVLVAAFTTVGLWAVAYLQRNAAFPMLADFESPLVGRFLRTQGAAVKAVDVNPAWGWGTGRVGRLTLLRGRYPGITLAEPYPGWAGRSRLRIDLYSLHNAPVDIVVRVSDIHHNNRFDDRFNRSFRIYPGAREIAIPLADIREAPASREMDMGHIREITIFAGDSTRNYVLLLDNIRLE
jgi:hypothetical protein